MLGLLIGLELAATMGESSGKFSLAEVSLIIKRGHRCNSPTSNTFFFLHLFSFLHWTIAPPPDSHPRGFS